MVGGDLVPPESDEPAVDSARKILNELKKYDESLYQKPRWLVLNKLDLVSEDRQSGIIDEIVNGLEWQGPVYPISAINRRGVDQLCQDIMNFLEAEAAIDDEPV